MLRIWNQILNMMVSWRFDVNLSNYFLSLEIVGLCTHNYSSRFIWCGFKNSAIKSWESHTKPACWTVVSKENLPLYPYYMTLLYLLSLSFLWSNLSQNWTEIFLNWWLINLPNHSHLFSQKTDSFSLTQNFLYIYICWSPQIHLHLE